MKTARLSVTSCKCQLQYMFLDFELSPCSKCDRWNNRMEQSVPKRRHIKLRRREITQKKENNRNIRVYILAVSNAAGFTYCAKHLDSEFIKFRYSGEEQIRIAQAHPRRGREGGGGGRRAAAPANRNLKHLHFSDTMRSNELHNSFFSCNQMRNSYND
jgi:hypothetical protein